MKKCRDCGREISEGHVRCDDCRKKMSEYQKSVYRRLKEQHICVKCRTRSVADGSAICAECLRVTREGHAARKADMDRLRAERILASAVGMPQSELAKAASAPGTKALRIDDDVITPDELHALSLCARFTYAGRTSDGCGACRSHAEGKCPFLEVLKTGRYGEMQLIRIGQKLTWLAFGLLKKHIEDTAGN